MKAFTIILFLSITIPAFSQVKLETNKTDEFSGDIVKKTNRSLAVFETEGGVKLLSGSYLGLSMSRVDTTMSFTLIVGPIPGCLSEYEGKSLIKLVDDSIIECMQISENNCDDGYKTAQYIPISRSDSKGAAILDIIQENSNKLSLKGVARIRVYSTIGYHDYVPSKKFNKFPPENLFIEHIKALK